VLAWWRGLVGNPLLSLARHGFSLYTRLRLLPYNRGRHYNFWTLVEEAPFGGGLHKVVDQIDAGISLPSVL
jgi:methionyl-tRNA formyltransferase